MEAAQSELTAKQAIKYAFEMFNEFFDGAGRRSNVLLEGLEYVDSDDQWLVTIGFDAGRVKETTSTLGFGQSVIEPIRETRQFFLRASDGKLVRMV